MSTSSTAPRRRRKAQPARRIRPLQIAIPTLLIVILVLFFVSQNRGGGRGSVIARLDTADVHALLFSPLDPQQIFFGHHGGIMVSDDQGSSWRDGSLTGADAMSLAASSQNPHS